MQISIAGLISDDKEPSCCAHMYTQMHTQIDRETMIVLIGWDNQCLKRLRARDDEAFDHDRTHRTLLCQSTFKSVIIQTEHAFP